MFLKNQEMSSKASTFVNGVREPVGLSGRGKSWRYDGMYLVE
jgi:hypothetical protein